MKPPKLSVLLPALQGYDTVASALDAWDGQTCRDQLEILILCRTVPTAAVLPGQVIVVTGSLDLHEARAAGIERASGEYIMLAEDHCLPDPDWARHILDRIDEGWEAVGCALRPGNRTSCWPEGSFLLGYSEWMMPIAGGPTKVICGWNGTIRAKLLRDLGSELSVELLMGAFLVKRLRDQGCRFYIEERARMRHFDPSGFAYQMKLIGIAGMGFGSLRSRRWPLIARLLYPLATPAIALLHWKRAFVQSRRAGPGARLRGTTLGGAAVLACAWGVGEAVGALIGVGRVTPLLWRIEVKPVPRADVARSTVWERDEALIGSEAVSSDRAGERI